MTTASTGDGTSGGPAQVAQDQQSTEASPQPPSTSEDRTARLQMTDISKRFGAVRAIRHADMTVDVGRVLAVVGENGAGKSTLIKILSGAVIADTGTITYEGRQVSIRSTSDAMALGIATVYQEPQLFRELTVTENIFMGREIRKGGRIDWAAQTQKVVELLALLELPRCLHAVAARARKRAYLPRRLQRRERIAQLRQGRALKRTKTPSPRIALQ